MILLKNNYFQLLKNFIIKNGKKITIFFLLIAIYNNLSHFIRKNILSDRIDFWDFHVYWCSANKFINGINPYGGETIKDCLTKFNFDLYFSYPPIILRSISFLGNLDFIYAKIIWIFVIISSFYLIVIFLQKIYSFKFLFFSLLLLFTGGGLIWGSLLAGNISVILYAILIIGIYFLINKKNNFYYFSVTLVSIVKFPFLIFFFLPLFLKDFKEYKKIIFYFSLTILIYFLQFYFDSKLFLSYINSTLSYKGENFLKIHGTGIGIHGIIDLYQGIIYEKTKINFFKPSGIYSFLLHNLISFTLFISAFFLFDKKKPNLKQKKFLISFFVAIFLCCFPRISSYDFFLLISSFVYVVNFSRIKLINKNWEFVITILTISILAIYDTRYPAFVISMFLFLCFYHQIKGNDPFYLKK